MFWSYSVKMPTKKRGSIDRKDVCVQLSSEPSKGSMEAVPYRHRPPTASSISMEQSEVILDVVQEILPTRTRKRCKFGLSKSNSLIVKEFYI